MTAAPPIGVAVRPATAAEAAAVAALVATRGLPLDGLDRTWRTWVALRGRQVVGTSSLERHDDALLLRSVAVAPSDVGAGVGALLVRAALREADAVGPVALLTETATTWFTRFGFTSTTRDQLPAALAASPELLGACPASATAMIRPQGCRPPGLEPSEVGRRSELAG